MKNTEKLFDFIEASPTAYHTIATVAHELRSKGYTELSLADEWMLSDGGKYYVTQNGSSLLSFRYRGGGAAFMIVASHSDSPSFRIKCTPERIGAYTRLNVERYGGSVYYSWFDRPLGIAGRAVVRTENGLSIRLFDLKENCATIPSVAPHLNRDINTAFSPNPAIDLLPLYTLDVSGSSLIPEIAESIGVPADKIVSHDLFLYNRERGITFGKDAEFILSPRLDDLECVYASLVGFLEARDTSSVPVLAIFDNEEVGSGTRQGAASTFFSDTLERIAGSDGAYRRALSSSFMVSADNAHAIHPNHPELSDPDCHPALGGGVTVKYNAQQRYATDGVSDAVFRTIAERAGVHLQGYTNRADIPGGSTLGSIANTRVPIPTVDIGIPQLAMHSASETAAVSDLDDAVSVFREFYSTKIRFSGGEIVM